MSENVVPYKNSEQGKKQQVQGMFDEISAGYDNFNRVMTMRMDIKWRKNVRKAIAQIRPRQVLDVATGTGDLAIELAKIPQVKVIGVDISEKMLEVGRLKISKLNLQNSIEMKWGDSEALPFSDESFDAVSVSFGVRNFENLEKGLSEIRRVLRPNGRLVVLETSVPENFFLKKGYVFYTKYIIPFMGRILSKDISAARYLLESASVFPYGKKFADILTKVGFAKVNFKKQNLGVATIYVADK